MHLVPADDTTDLDWKLTCDDCIDGEHRRCRRRRKCACSSCKWGSTRSTAEVETESDQPVPARRRSGRLSMTHAYNPANDEACLRARQLLDGGVGITAVARQLNIDRVNLSRAMQKRGLYP